MGDYSNICELHGRAKSGRGCTRGSLFPVAPGQCALRVNGGACTRVDVDTLVLGEALPTPTPAPTPTPTPTPAPSQPMALTRNNSNASARQGQGIGTLTNVEPGATVTLLNSAGNTVTLEGLEVRVGAVIPQAVGVVMPVFRKLLNGVNYDYPFLINVGIAPYVADKFPDAANTDVTTRPTATGLKAWTGTAGFKANGAGRLQLPATGGAIKLSPTQTAYHLSATFKNFANGTGGVSAAEFRFRQFNNDIYFYLRADPRANAVTLVYYQNGAEYEQACVGCNLPSGTETNLGMRIDGPDITVFVNGVEEFTYSNSYLAEYNTVGIGHAFNDASAGVAQVWDFSISPIMGTIVNWPRFSEPDNAQPIVPLGTNNAWDKSDCNNPNVVFDPPRNRWVLDYSGYSNTANNDDQVQHAGIATAPSLNGPWTKDPANPNQLADAEVGQYGFNGGLVWSASRGEFIRIYGCSNPGGIRLARSATGAAGSWVKQAGLTFPNAFDAALRRLKDGRLEAWYVTQDGGANGYLNRKFNRSFSSDEGLTWTADPNNPVLAPGAEQGGRDHALYKQDLGEPWPYSVPSGDQNHTLVVHDGIRLKSGVTPGDPGYDGKRGLHYAVTFDNCKTWRRFIGAFSAFGNGYASAQAFDSCLVDDGSGTLRMFHGGSNVPGAALNLNIQIGVATATAPVQLWTP